MSKGILITFEGGEGVGKTTQIQLLANHLKQTGLDVITTREPGGTPAAEEVRNLLSHKEYGGKWTPEAELMLLFVARAQHIRDVIKPAIDAGKIVVCDRYIDSTRVYQGHLQNIPMDFILDLEDKIVGDYIPDLTLLLDLDENIAIQRVKSRGVGDHYDQGDIHFYKSLRDGFLNLARENNQRVKIINAEKSIDDISADIQTTIKQELRDAF